MALGDILGRVGSILSSNVNDLLDRAEDPVKMSAEFLRKANSELAEVRHEVAMVIASYEDTRRAYAENDAEIADWQGKAQLALQAGREDLARKALGEKQREEQENGDLRAVLEEQKKQVDSLKGAAEQLRAKIADMERQRDVLVAQHRTALARQHVQSVASGIGKSNALAGFDRLKQRTQHEMSVATAMESMDEGTLDDEFKQLQSGGGDSKVEAELAAMKSNMGLAAPRATPELPAGFVEENK